ncbi:hypothetical protein MJO28_012727 [Puccinia striiformis f. sp. tritici]|uniref:Uncharacterized protein n=2 Tax=Puccinia striiformis TaxID=27350 RepID=A0A2S4UTW8_9BASI|nr:hypothetical protein Pst134EA_022389 [Puccinia striiformis f. sp. tritici]KAH9445426.1 hypothetical protein Pst134EB_023268 [Puccinia striiformis f. sp. tritici]KAH9454898.1 hypothetical protein Pst134EA_022389 [Puccinia striiformis f. sp. tritici]KAI7942700.1 hypothetical protein MJO28_012727 [Puccinia striiformis f. sp. tritici]POW00734.1 hypothetical protein PSTT_12926 [Puccinia striiformis]
MTPANLVPTTIIEINQEDQQLKLKLKHLSISTKPTYDSLSAYYSLITSQQQQITPNHHSKATHKWCDACLASCLIKVNLETHQVAITCQKSVFVPLDDWNCLLQQPSLVSQSIPKPEPITTATPIDPLQSSSITSQNLKTSIESTTTDTNPQKSKNSIKKLKSMTTTNSTSKKQGKKNRNNSTKSALTDLLNKKKLKTEDHHHQSQSNNLHSFLTQL